MSDLEVTADGTGRYRFTLDGGTDHVVTVAPDLLADLGLTGTEEPLLVRKAIELAAARGTGLPTAFALSDLDFLQPGWREVVVAAL